MGIFDTLKKKKIGTPKAPRKTEASAPEHTHAHEDKKPDAAPKPKTTVRAGSRAHAVLIRPHLSEKTAMQEAHGVYAFVVARNATKIAVKEAVKDIYGVMPAKVRMIHTEGKQTRTGRMTGRRSDWKKALVTVPAGKALHIHEGV
jgi:large subunit ribosomal protein L23